MLKFNQVITAVAVTFFVNGAALAQQEDHQHGNAHTQEHAEIAFVRAEVVEVDLEHNELVLRHEAIEHLNMAAMTMAFSAADGIDISHLSEGDEIKVKVERQDRDFVIIEMDTNQHTH
ncbi:hypothetical protein CWE12_13065 [Aliidiomarina sedimenti]|uniref:Copper-binding protein n=1 Tax=Aliidiomarina sedimenti TaxID=1933879 RepID=A0ABY0BVB3_9GAMM|nr:copper-binding protein [Aliidiomarina sedimenti]RUO28144.1 hypothetical protein CWE12_13065 [Aliidiomarina sedimenti]